MTDTKPTAEEVQSTYSQLRASSPRTNEMVLLALREGVVRRREAPSRWYFVAARAEAIVGDQYASSGRVRSQGIARMRRRAVQLGLIEDNRCRDMTLTCLGREVVERYVLAARRENAMTQTFRHLYEDGAG